ncbi:MAG: DUF2911 domain-containing protein [Planctomycetes bacterium]|nr:DUF2911 domain-containing protein [Planctomycetota bacterium]
MHTPILATALTALCLTVPAFAQEGSAPKPVLKEASAQKFKGMAFAGERHTTTLAMFSDDFSVGYMAVIQHGQPEWKAEYDNQMDMLKGKLNRLGKDFWTTLQTTTDLEFGGVKIPAGSYCVALACSKEGEFSLALIDASKAMQAGALPFGPQNWKPEISVPLTLNKGAAAEVVEAMTMTFDADKTTPGKGSFTLAWGKHTLTAPVMMHPPTK